MLTCNDVISRIEQQLSGEVCATALASWAFAYPYAYESGEEEFPPAPAALIEAVLDAMTFADNAAFALDAEALHIFIKRLQQHV